MTIGTSRRFSKQKRRKWARSREERRKDGAEKRKKGERSDGAATRRGREGGNREGENAEEDDGLDFFFIGICIYLIYKLELEV